MGRDSRFPHARLPLEVNRQTDPVLEGHIHHHLEFNAIFRGSMRYRLGTKELLVPSGRCALLWAAVPHALVEVEPGTDVLALAVPIATCLRWQGCGALYSRLMTGELFLLPPWAGDLVMAERWTREGADPQRRAFVLLEFEACVRRCALAIAEEGTSPAEDAVSGDRIDGEAAFSRMLAVIHDRLDDPMVLHAAAHASDLKRDTATRLFRRYAGLPPRAYLQSLRIAAAHRELVSSDRSITDIALSAGFGSLGRFYAAFSAAYGRTPSAVRDEGTKSEE